MSKHVVGPEPGDLADSAWTQEFLDPNPQASPLHLVARKRANPFGLHDTLGNVWEYTRDALTPALVPYLPTNDPVALGGGAVLGVAWDQNRAGVLADWTLPGWSQSTSNTGFRVLKQFEGEPLPSPLDRPLVLRAGQPLSVHALVPRPEKIPGLQSWSLELAGPHSGEPTSGITASPKGDLIATGSSFGKISLWDRDGNYQRALLGHEGSVSWLEFSRDGRWLVSGADDVRVWNVATGAIHALIPIPYKGVSRRARFSPDGNLLAVGMDWLYQTSFFIVDLTTGRTRSPSTDEQRSRGLAWSPDSTQLASSTTDSRLRIWDVATLKVLREIDVPRSGAVEWSPDGQWLAHQWFPVQSGQSKVVIRDAKTLEVTKTLATSTFATPSAWLPDSRRLAVGAGENSGVFDSETGEQLTKFNPGSSGIALLDEGQQAVFEGGNRLHIYDTSTGQKLREGKEGAGMWEGATKLAASGREVFVTTRHDVSVFDAATGNQLRRLRNVFPEYGPDVFPAPDGLLLATNHPTALLLDTQTGAKRQERSHGQSNVTRVAWSPDGKWLATGATDKLVRVWNVATGKIEHELAGHTGTIWSLAWSPDGTRLASAAEDKTVRLWNPLAGKLVATYDQFPEATNFSRGRSNEAQQLAWATDSRRLWIVLTNHIVPLDVDGDVAAFAKNAGATMPDRTQPRTLASAATVRGTFGPLENFSNGNVVTFLNTSPDGQRLLVREMAGWTYVRGRDAQDRRLLGQWLGNTAQWHPDSRRCLGWEPSYGTVGFDVETNRRLGILFAWLTGDHWLCLGPTGHYRGSPGVEDQIVYVALHPDGSQRTYTPAEFAKTFGWKNDPEKAALLGK